MKFTYNDFETNDCGREVSPAALASWGESVRDCAIRSIRKRGWPEAQNSQHAGYLVALIEDWRRLREESASEVSKPSKTVARAAKKYADAQRKRQDLDDSMAWIDAECDRLGKEWHDVRVVHKAALDAEREAERELKTATLVLA